MDASAHVQKTGPLLPPWEIAAAEKAVEIAKALERQVGAHRKNPGGQPQKYFLSDAGRQLILSRYDSQTETITWLAEQLSTPEQDVPRWQVRKWAKDLGIARIKEPPWSEAEISYLRNSVRRYGLKKIAKALGRTETSVKLKAKRLGIRKIVTGDGYTMRAICRGLGVDHHQVERWLVNEWFWGERRESRRHGRQRGDIWYFTPEAIRELVRQHPEEVDLRRVDRDFFIEALLGPPQAVDARPVPAEPRQAARSVYAYLSDEAHTLLTAHYTGGLRRTEALAEVLGVTPDEVVTWAVLLGLEDSSLHHPHVHEQEGRKRRANASAGRAAHSTVSQSIRHLLDMRFTGDPGAAQALADDLGLTLEEVYVLAKAAGISTEPLAEIGKSEPGARAEKTQEQAALAGKVHGQQAGASDRIPLQAQLLIAMRYHDADSSLEQLAEELTGMLDASEAPVSVDQLDAWARRLGLRSRRKPQHSRSARCSDEAARRKPARLIAFDALQLDAREWPRFLSADARRMLLPTDAAPELLTVEELRLGYQVQLGALERGKAPQMQDQDIIAAAMQAEARLSATLLPLVWRQALTRLGQEASLEALLAVGRCGLDEAIARFDYADSYPLLSQALPAITREMEYLLAATSSSRPEGRHAKKLRLYAQIANASGRLARAQGHAPTVETIAAALSLAPDQVEQAIRFVTRASWADEASDEVVGSGRERVPDGQFVDAFMKTQGQDSRAIISELAAELPLTALTIQVKFYALRLHTRIAERDRRRELARLRLEARRAEDPLLLPRGHFLWDVVVDGHTQRWALDAPYGTLAGAVSTGRRLSFNTRLYEAERVYFSTLVVSSVEAAVASL